jgi:hypothetical protein
MRLLELQDDGQLSLTKDLSDDATPPYGILSHTWGEDEQEVTFIDVTDNTTVLKEKAGYQKIEFCGKQAASDGLQYFWVDTCCIDKSNSTELSEAINSMFRWYQNAAKCYVYLSDVSVGGQAQTAPSSAWQPAFRASRWFTRGWTLQELMAPNSVEFFSSEGELLGDKTSLELQLHSITGIPVSAFQAHPSEFSTIERMSWSEGRQTKRAEDGAYCLLGIFGVYLPLIYGEGRENAFIRLREEIDKRSGFPRQLSQGRLTSADISRPFYYIPFPKNKRFVGRVAVLEILEKMFTQKESQRVAVVGLGGMGKTQVALQFAYWVKENQP